MDPMSLSAAALAALAPYAIKGAEAIAAEMGKKTLGLAGGLLKGLWGRWREKPAAREALEAYVADPATGRERFGMTLAVELAGDGPLKEEVEKLLHGGAPDLFVRQVVDKADEVIGVQVTEMLSGRADVDQDVGEAKKVVGIDAGRIGGA